MQILAVLIFSFLGSVASAQVDLATPLETYLNENYSSQRETESAARVLMSWYQRQYESLASHDGSPEWQGFERRLAKNQRAIAKQTVQLIDLLDQGVGTRLRFGDRKQNMNILLREMKKMIETNALNNQIEKRAKFLRWGGVLILVLVTMPTHSALVDFLAWGIFGTILFTEWGHAIFRNIATTFQGDPDFKPGERALLKLAEEARVAWCEDRLALPQFH